ncbi:hypothetical protein GUITHDRAFT_155134 [Guillardia theta CCMP2712]|uniref:Uncharacterized protein n=1 Tax=Guillardia theta (strain CCMP2712) TaxID=905079 RepID=L1IL69_GUITC|nr:hypothetical protein GUITHDRAFT_155134 [Guillardia theta CCMP2712]EKX36857.1 hypothetical protein GUITHDRAFT_155134 [Guillardia theta CCMP2712]|eukprot:XP_005823837.1 hypothetical protein GUITHDRAFT_155134 [Guillardia theta CCMP2712]
MAFQKKIEQLHTDFTHLELSRNSSGSDSCQAASDDLMQMFWSELPANACPSSSDSPKKICSHCSRLNSKAIDSQGNVECAGCYRFFKDSQDSLEATIDDHGNFRST